MVLTENALKTYLEQRHIHITEQKKSEILEYLGKEPGEQEDWTEQDLYEHLRKMVETIPNIV